MTVKKVEARRDDVNLAWLVESYGGAWNEWRHLGAKWISIHTTAIFQRLTALTWFFEKYLIGMGLPSQPGSIFLQDFNGPSIISHLRNPGQYGILVKGYTRNDSAIRINNRIHEFLEWVLLDLYGVEDDFDRLIVPAEYRNPVPRLDYEFGLSSPKETVRNALPYRYIDELRNILCPIPGGSFNDWQWAQSALDDERQFVDWIPVYYDQIDTSDPDCVWRSQISPAHQIHLSKIGKKRKVVELWSPVRAMVLYLKLELPLRTFQVRLLDSGEADTWRYSNGDWIRSTTSLGSGTISRPLQRGVFRRLIYGGDIQVGLYVNTNKTADIGKDPLDRGYVIPWRHERVLYWLQKLRNWQEKYNPITKPTPWLDLKTKHLNDVKSPKFLEKMGTTCFLFRHAAAETAADRDKPITSHHVALLWTKLLRHLEKRCRDREEFTKSGEPFKFVKDDSRRGSLYPLHCLRVSLLTSFAVEGGVPIPILSKLVAGHSRIIMTLYYTKVGQAQMNAAMNEAERRIIESRQAQFEKFLIDAEYKQIKALSVFNDESGINAIDQTRNPGAWEFMDKGICPVGCTGCYNGGSPVNSSNGGFNKSYLHVPKDLQGSPRNCVRCRWFISGPAFLPGLVAHFNNLSYEASEISKRYCEYTDRVSALENEQWDCNTNQRTFLKSRELVTMQQLQMREAERADTVMNDMHATMKIIKKNIEIAVDVDSPKSGIALIGGDDIKQLQINTRESISELHQLEIVCRNAIIYPGYDATRATLRRSQIIDAMLLLHRRQPILLGLTTNEQLFVGDAIMRLIESRTGSLESAVGVVTATEALMDLGILNEIQQFADPSQSNNTISARQLTEALELSL